MTDTPLQSALASARFGANRDDWSTDFSPAQCRALVEREQAIDEATRILVARLATPPRPDDADLLTEALRLIAPGVVAEVHGWDDWRRVYGEWWDAARLPMVFADTPPSVVPLFVVEEGTEGEEIEP